jgi:hypothetical protein
VEVLRGWLIDHWDEPYPNARHKEKLAAKTGLKYDQVQHWFVIAHFVCSLSYTVVYLIHLV